MSSITEKKYFYTSVQRRYLASRLVKSSDSHASDPCSRMGGSSWLCYGIISLQSSMKCEKFISGATLLSEGELESTWPCSIQKYCRVQRNREFVPVQWGRWGRLTMKRYGRESTGRLYGRGTNPCVTCWKDPYNGPERGKLREVNPVSAINTDEEKSGKRRAEACGNSAPLPHMAQSPPYSVVHHEFLAIGRLNPVLCLDAIPQVGQMSSGRT